MPKAKLTQVQRKARDEAIIAEYEKDRQSSKTIGKQFNLSGEMVMKIVNRSRKTGYAFRTSEQRKKETAQRRNEAAKNASAHRVQRRRDKLRALGMRPIQIWVPDTRAPGFAEEAARQARLVAAATSEDDLEFLDRLADDVIRED
jgi:transposase